MSGLRTIRIATRTSPLALYQANAVKQQLETLQYPCELVPVESTGDMQLTQPIYAMGISGVFTKQLDIALLENRADIAVHSLKDVPTQLAAGLTIPAVLERGAHEDVAIIKKEKLPLLGPSKLTVATSSLRRRSQWLCKYPQHTCVPIRGNVQTRLQKFENGDADVVIFAKAGLERMNLLPDNAVVLDWMLPAPAQGIIGIVCREEDEEIVTTCKQINHAPSFMAGHVERQFLQTLMGGCSVPISGLARVNQAEISFTGAIHGFDGQQYFEVKKTVPIAEWQNAGEDAANNLLQQNGVAELLTEIRNKNWQDEGAIN